MYEMIKNGRVEYPVLLLSNGDADPKGSLHYLYVTVVVPYIAPSALKGKDFNNRKGKFGKVV